MRFGPRLPEATSRMLEEVKSRDSGPFLSSFARRFAATAATAELYWLHVADSRCRQPLVD